jgi:microcystin degradation protein MlrC
LATVQPWLDIPGLGTSVVVIADGDPDLARTKCAELSSFVWDHRRDYLPTLVSVAEGVRAAFAQKEGLVVLSDSADATTSGSTGDSNHVLREMLKYDWARPALVTLVDPDLVADAERRGVGADLNALLGGKRNPACSTPLPAVVRVERIFDARFVMSGHLAKNMSIDMGRSAVLSIGNIDIVATSRTGPHFAPQLFEAAGIDPFGAQLLIAKSPCGFRQSYAPRAKQIFVVRAPGCAPSDFWKHPYHRITRPLWPWDEIEGWTPAPVIVRSGREF